MNVSLMNIKWVPCSYGIMLPGLLEHFANVVAVVHMILFIQLNIPSLYLILIADLQNEHTPQGWWETKINLWHIYVYMLP